MEKMSQIIRIDKLSQKYLKPKNQVLEWETKLREDNIKVFKEAYGSDILIKYLAVLQKPLGD